MEHVDRYAQLAVDMVASGKAQRAFELDTEDPRLRDAYGRDSLGEKALLARRLVEAGVTFVLVSGAWGYFDHHGDNVRWGGIEKGLKPLLPRVDQALATLVNDLEVARPARPDAGADDGRVRPLAGDQPARRAASTGRTSCRWSWPAAACGTAR